MQLFIPLCCQWLVSLTEFYKHHCFPQHNNYFHFIVKPVKTPIRYLERKIRLSICPNKPLRKLIKRHYHPSCALIRLRIYACYPFKRNNGLWVKHKGSACSFHESDKMEIILASHVLNTSFHTLIYINVISHTVYNDLFLFILKY